MVEEVKSSSPLKMLGVTRAFSHFLALANSAENHHRVRRLRERLLDSGTESALPMKRDSLAGNIAKLKDEMGISPQDIHQAISNQSIEIVLTAHPTEVNRRTTIQKHQRINSILDQLDRSDITSYERRYLMQDLNGQISSIWHSDELRRTKPGPIKEARSGIAVVENVLWNAVPRYLRKVNDVLLHQIGQPLPLTASPIRIASWMGGDRDGNPNVVPEITFQVSVISRWTAASLFKADIIRLVFIVMPYLQQVLSILYSHLDYAQNYPCEKLTQNC